MKKCNYCGSVENPIIYSHPFEPRACVVCASQFFQSIGGKAVPKQYDRDSYIGIISQIHPVRRGNLGRILEGYYEKAVAREMRYVMMGNILRIVFQTEYRKKHGIIVIEMDTVTGTVKHLREIDERKVQDLVIKLNRGLPIF